MSKNIPQLRFEGFTYDWEQRKLGEYVIDYVEKTTVQNQFPVLTSSQKQGIVLQEKYFTNRQVTTDNNIGYYVLPKGYFTFRSRSDNDIFVFNRNDIIDKGIISYFYPVFTLKKADSNFFLKRINNGIQRQLSIQAEGTGQHVLSLKKFKSIVTMFPSIEEQQKIGLLFKQLDETITLQERKLDLLKEQKKGYLQKMFPKNGAKVPELRFAGFADDWEERKLGDMMDVTSVKRIHQSDWTNSGIRFLRARDIVSAAKNEEPSDYLYISEEKYNEYSKISGKVSQGDLLVTGVGSIGVPLLITDDNPIYFKDGNIIWFKNEHKIDGNFFYYSFINNKIQKYIRDVAGIGTVGTYTIDSGKKTPISLPTYDEQIKIGSFFKQLDDTIALHQRKLDLLKEQKKGFLQKMFV